MKSSPKSENFRRHVPLVLNGLVVCWYFADDEPFIRMEIPVRVYPKDSTIWRAEQILVQFEQRCRTHMKKDDEDYTSKESVVEWFYVCDNPAITFTETSVPVLRK